MNGFGVLILISLVGIVVTVGWVIVVSFGIRRDDRGTVFNASRADLSRVVPGRAARIARQTTGVHWI